MRRSLLASLLVVLFVVHIVLIHSPGPWVYSWAATYALFYASQELLIRQYESSVPDDAAIARWGHAAAIGLTVSGLIWGVGFYHFIEPEQPLSIGLLIAAMAALTAGSIGMRSTILAGFVAFNLGVTLPMALRFFLEAGGTFHVPLITGVNSDDRSTFNLLGYSVLIYALVILGYGRAQHKLIADSLSMRFSNEALVVALREESLAAESARHEAERANLAKSQFLAAASHDLRQPLYALSLFSGSLGELKLSHSARAIVSDIQHSISAMEQLFATLLDISKLEAGVVQPCLEPVAVDALFDRLSQYFRPIALNQGLDLRFRSDGEWVTSDGVLLEQILGNLISNALRWTQEGGVLVAARRRGAAINLEVWDTGIGISVDDRLRIFDDFVQIDNAERDRRKGLGLGLAIARRSAALIGSDIALASRPGVGSRFSIRQPVAEPLPPRPLASDRQIVSAVARDPLLPVLIVDDDSEVRSALRLLVDSWNVDATIVGSPAEALSAIDFGRRFGLVLSDYRLGDTTGLSLIHDIGLRHPAPSPNAVLITGDIATDVIAEAHARGVTLVHKPIHPQDLSRLLGVDTDRPGISPDQ